VKLDPFYLIVDDASWLERLLPLGVRLVQLRVKDRPESDVRAQIRRARALCATYAAQLVVNDFWRLALEEDCDFVHLGQGDLGGADLPALRARGVRLGVSTHDEPERIGIWKERVGATPLVAIGGLTPERAGQSLKAGADSACVVTDILLNKDPESRTREWFQATAPWRG
jgi:thiamine-phosphate pyrophosphorylase